jgi:hypothetical protein
VFEHDDDISNDVTARIAASLKSPVRLDPAFDARVMARVAALPAHRPAGPLDRTWSWLRRPRSFAVSPLAGLAAAAGVAAIVFFAARAPAPRTSEAAVALDRTPVEFLLVAPRASSVMLVGDFNDWTRSATPLRTIAAGGLWSVTVPLAPGRYRYAFVVDGKRWEPDPSAPPAPDDEFGSPASVVTVGGGL